MIETGVIRALCGAIDDLQTADAATRHGFVSDYIRNAIVEIKKAIETAIGGEDE